MTVGMLGNLSLLYHQLFLHCAGCRLRSIALILKHVVLSNSLVIISKGTPQIALAFGWKPLFTHAGCKFLRYMERVGRGMSIGTTCLLSMFQAVTIGPTGPCWKSWKTKCPQYLGSSILLCWVLCLSVNGVFPLYLSYAPSKWSSKNMTRERDFGDCSTKDHDDTTNILYTLLVVFPELSFSLLILWASGSMVLFLHRHRQRARCLHRTRAHSRSSPETRATQSILALASTFVAFHTLSSIIHACVAHFHNPGWWLVNLTAFLSREKQSRQQAKAKTTGYGHS
ncbi:PREDICTED: vomeronasal type-1 receptor 4-like [Condylura cristata]|uniref:vomeronasal type-1 receptor 4-like n=1 Tax=Condylura cristata TaxID=143302 RepID=UPI000334691D|nr:PREDICTED: vomeronasal type-1 receptor 4-like [Condylura cristata]